MRLISQDGLIDVPYEYGSLSVGVGKVEEIEHAVIKYRNASSPVGTKLAEYSSKAKALKVMEMLRECKETKEIKSMLLTKSILESFTNTKIKNFEIHTDGIGDYFKADIVKKVEYFKFPADEEIEV